jgi:hypothetical protein
MTPDTEKKESATEAILRIGKVCAATAEYIQACQKYTQAVKEAYGWRGFLQTCEGGEIVHARTHGAAKALTEKQLKDLGDAFGGKVTVC